MSIQPRDREILDALCHVRFFTVGQVARVWWHDAKNNLQLARRRLGQLQKAEAVVLFHAPARSELPLAQPVATWQPGLPGPNFGQLSRVVKGRWRGLRAATTPCLRLASSDSREPKVVEATHDLHLAAVYLLMRHELPTRAKSWRFETEFARPGEKVPDALVRDGFSTTAIDFGGDYGPEQLKRIHDYCEERRYGYEIW